MTARTVHGCGEGCGSDGGRPSAHPAWAKGVMAVRWVAVVLALLTGGPASAGGAVAVYIPADRPDVYQTLSARGGILQTDEIGIIIFRDGRETLILQPAYAGPQTRIAWIIPVPSLPSRKEILPLSDDFIDRDCLRDTVEAVLLDTAPLRDREITPLPTTLKVSPAIAGVMPPVYAAGRVILSKARGAVGPPCFRWPSRVFVKEARMALHGEANLGLYSIAIFPSKDAAGLTKWLDEEAFITPQGLPDTIAEYGARGWSFVVATTGPDYMSDGPNPFRVTHLEPLAISFAAPRPIYPLKISRPGAPPVMCVELVILAPEPVRLAMSRGSPLCEEALPAIVSQMRARQAVGYPGYAGVQRRPSPPKIFLDATRRQLAQETNYCALICEARAPLEKLTQEQKVTGRLFPAGLFGGHITLPACQYLLAKGQKIDASDLYATRFWGLLRREVLEDLVFELQPPANAAVGPSPRKEGLVPFAMRERASGPPVLTPFLKPFLLGAPPIFLAWLVASLLIRPMQRWFGSCVAGGAAQKPRWHERHPCLTALLGLAVLTVPLAAAAPLINPDIGTDMQIAAAVLWPFWLAGMVIAPAVLGYQAARRAGPVLGTCLGVVVLGGAWYAVVLAAPNFQDFSAPLRNFPWVLVSATLMGLYSLLASVLASAFRRPGQPLRAWPLAVYVGLVAGMLLAGAEASRTQKLPTPNDVASLIPGTMFQVTGAIAAFASENGALPKDLRDLTSTGPVAEGVDTSGNPVPLNLPGGRKPYLEKLPIDPLSGRRDTWTYDPTGDLVVDSNAWDWVWVETISFPPAPSPAAGELASKHLAREPRTPPRTRTRNAGQHSRTQKARHAQ